MGRKLLAAGSLSLVLVVAVGWAVSGPRNTPVSAATLGGRAAQRSSALSSTAGGAVRVVASQRIADIIAWHILSSYTARRITNAYLPATARGIYLITDVVATNASRHAVPLNGDHVTVDLNGTEYPLDASALSALELAGDRALVGTELGPGATATGWVVFDVPPSAIRSTPRLCLETHPAHRAAAPARCTS